MRIVRNIPIVPTCSGDHALDKPRNSDSTVHRLQDTLILSFDLVRAR